MIFYRTFDQKNGEKEPDFLSKICKSSEYFRLLLLLFFFFWGGGGGGFSSPVDYIYIYILYIYTTFGGYIMNLLYFTKWRLVQGDV